MTEPSIFLDGRVKLFAGDCLEILAGMPDASVDAVVTDPPYHLSSMVKRLSKAGAGDVDKNFSKTIAGQGKNPFKSAASGFMGKIWDGGGIAFDPETWAEVLRVLKPGGHLVAFGAPRNAHRLACAIEDAGFEIRDRFIDLIETDTHIRKFIASLSASQADAFLRCLDDSSFGHELFWAFGSGFPKSHDASQSIEKLLTTGAARRPDRDLGGLSRNRYSGDIEGKLFADTGGKVDLTRLEAIKWQGFGTALKPAYEPIILARKPLIGTVAENVLAHGTGALNIDGCRVEADSRPARDARVVKGASANGVYGDGINGSRATGSTDLGRWPANIVLDGSEEVVGAFPDAPGQQRALHGGEASKAEIYGKFGPKLAHTPRGDSGSAARFFYSSKADADDRIGSKHPTVKPVDLVRWLVRLVTPPGGTVLDPFAGTGTTGEAAFYEGVNAILIEREGEYQADIARRMRLVMAGPATRKQAISAAKKPKGDLPLFGASS